MIVLILVLLHGFDIGWHVLLEFTRTIPHRLTLFICLRRRPLTHHVFLTRVLDTLSIPLRLFDYRVQEVALGHITDAFPSCICRWQLLTLTHIDLVLDDTISTTITHHLFVGGKLGVCIG